MIGELSDEKILEYLITSDYIENYTPQEYKFLLMKFKYFYRLLHGKYTLDKGQKDQEIERLNSIIESMKNTIYQEQVKSSELQNKIDLSKKERVLTLKERWQGKIKQFDDNGENL
jgi:hypothetical protein